MKKQIDVVLSQGFRQYKGLGTTQGSAIQNEIAQLTEELNSVAGSFGVAAEYSVGVGRWSAVPWIRLFFRSYSPSAQSGVYIVYLFSATEDAVYLTLNQGTTHSSREHWNKVRNKIQQVISKGHFEEGNGSLDFGDGKSYGESVIFYKRYQKGLIPDDEVLKSDVESLLNIYSECKKQRLLESFGEIDNSVTEETKSENYVKTDDTKVTLGVAEEKNFNENNCICFFEKMITLQKIFFGAPGTGKSYKANEFVNDVVLSVYKRDERREKFAQSGMPKASHYADVLNNADSFGIDIFGIDHVSELEEHLKSCEDDDKVKNPRHSALRSYIEFLKISKVYRTTFHPDYDYAQFVGSYKAKSVCDTSSIGIQDPGNLSISDLIDIAKQMHDDEIAHPYARLGTLYYKSLKALSKSMVGAKKEICDKSGDGMDNGPELNTGIFIGEYLEENIVSKETKISYSFVPQVFAKAYVAAWKNLNQPVYLVIEEINRGNCAQIFGDLFQLLDRSEDGYSSYEIDADADFAEWIEMQLDSSAVPQNDIPEEIRSGRKLRLPPNFNILATMNTSDQSLFPMDSAFKRRFDWEYVPIDFEGKDCANYQIKIDDEKSYSWQKFVESVNTRIFDITDSEDKQLGEYFIKLIPADNGIITKDRFLGKVMFYLWNEVCKDVHKQESFFRESENGTYFSFQDLYKKNGNEKLISFMDWIAK